MRFVHWWAIFTAAKINRRHTRLFIARALLGMVLLSFLGGAAMALELKSLAFQKDGVIPRQHTCEGQDVSPELRWSDPPVGTVSFVLICDDPDAPGGDWVHWVIYNIPGTSKVLSEGVSPAEVLSDGTRQGLNDSQSIGYSGPCPPPGKPHHYFFKLYACDATFTAKDRAKKADLLLVMEGHILAQAQLVGIYKR